MSPSSSAHAPVAQTGMEKKGTLANVLPGHHVQLVFAEGVNYDELTNLEQLEDAGVIDLGECRGAISLILGDRKWRDGEPGSRTFTFHITNQYTFDSFKEKLPVKLFESITLLD